ncbi:MAG: hypothetical protein KAR42_07555 [candidate division Zixibacteria bacterium]|nr:hypothetical protein [candidate division Zixibacteria bacterium]
MRFLVFKTLPIAFTLIMALNPVFAAGTVNLIGTVLDMSGEPIIGASVIVKDSSVVVGGASTDLAGRFSITITQTNSDSIHITLSSIGYTKAYFVLASDSCESPQAFRLNKKAVDVGTVKVTASPRIVSSKRIITREQIARAAQTSLVPTNPISAINQPEVARAGSQHSSKLRVFGTSPEYYLNDISIGQDPNHYGVFSIIPGSVIETIDFYPYGTPAEYSRSAILAIKTPKQFDDHLGGKLNLSLIEATGLVSAGNDRLFVLASMRKSILDKLIHHLDIQSDRRTIPPTNFQDIFVSAGYQLSSSLYLITDQFHSRDYLAYATESSKNNPLGVSTYQHSRENYGSIRLEGYYPKVKFTLRTAGNIVSEDYAAHSGVPDSRGGLQVDLEAYKRQFFLVANAEIQIEKASLAIGQSSQYISRRLINMKQINWNFMPPDATSDNPYVFQKALNKQYDNYHKWDDEINSSGFLSLKVPWRNFELQSGGRIDYFGSLKERYIFSFRQSVLFAASENNRFELKAGTYAENPAGRILETYQVLVHANLNKLNPMRTFMSSLKYSYNGFSVTLFQKRVRAIPILVPQYNPVDKSLNTFIHVESEGSQLFRGGSLSFTAENLFDRRFELSGYYGYTKAEKSSGPVTVPFSVNSPHAAYVRGDYQLHHKLSVGADIHFKSGFAYTPVYGSDILQSDEMYSEEFYEQVQKLENSERFPAYILLNLHFNYKFGKTEVFGAVSNVTNQKNPMINTREGYIYDAGILPTIGLTHTF